MAWKQFCRGTDDACAGVKSEGSEFVQAVDPARHWDKAYAQGHNTRSWFQDRPSASLRMLKTAGVSARNSLIDVAVRRRWWMRCSTAAGTI